MKAWRRPIAEAICRRTGWRSIRRCRRVGADDWRKGPRLVRSHPRPEERAHEYSYKDVPPHIPSGSMPVRHAGEQGLRQGRVNGRTAGQPPPKRPPPLGSRAAATWMSDLTLGPIDAPAPLDLLGADRQPQPLLQRPGQCPADHVRLPAGRPPRSGRLSRPPCARSIAIS